MKNPVTRLKAILGDLLRYGRATADGTADLQVQLGRFAAILDPLPGRLQGLEGSVADACRDLQGLGGSVARANSEQVHQARLAAALDPLGARLEQVAATLVPVEARLEQLAAALDPLGARLEQLAAALDPLGARLEQVAATLVPVEVRLKQLEDAVAKADSEIVHIQATVANVSHSFGMKPWPDLFDPFATEEIARRTFCLGRLLTPLAPQNYRKVRVGPPYDGGYVMIDDWEGVLGAISIGIGDNDAWDRDVLARGIRVAQFDHTIAAAPTDMCGIVWQRMGIGPDDMKDLRSLRSIVRLADFPAEGDLLLKLDTEGAEWDALQSEEAAPLDRFRQMVIEFHWFDRIADDAWFATARRTIERICCSHAPIHVHANNWVGMSLLGGVSFPRVLEVTFARKGVYRLKRSDELFPTSLDAPNHSGRPEHFLGTFQFPGAKLD